MARTRGARSILRWNALTKSVAAVAVLGVITGFAVIYEGYEAQQTPVDDGALWVLQRGDGERYARVNTDLLELDTVKNAASPGAIAQSGDTAVLFTEGLGKAATISNATPLDYPEDTEIEGVTSTPSGTSAVYSAGDNLVFFAEDIGAVSAGRLGEDTSTARSINPHGEDDVDEDGAILPYSADAVAVDESGRLYLYSGADSEVTVYDLDTDEVVSTTPLPGGPSDGAASITAVAGTWLVVSTEDGTAWLEGDTTPLQTGLTDGVVAQAASMTGDVAYLADSTGLVSVDLESDQVTRVVGAPGTTLGTPAVPRSVAGNVYAAWLPEGAGPGTLWDSAQNAAVDLGYGGQTLPEGPDPVLVDNGSRVVLNEQRSGWVWSDAGTLVQSSLSWATEQPVTEEDSDEEPPESVDPKPPVAVDDDFGVRAGQLVTLPVLLNDHDPNDDVLAIVPESLSELSTPDFGTLSITNNAQELAIQVAPDATGSVTFDYKVSDGSQTNGRQSNAATVTLTVKPLSVNTAPAWCNNDPLCQQEWPQPQVEPGGSVTAEVLRGWVDPEGDPIFVSDAEDDDDVGTVAATPAGRLVFRHHDANAADTVAAPVTVTVSDIWGKSATKSLQVTVTPDPTLSAESFAVQVKAGEVNTVELQERVSGTRGTVSIADVVARDERGVQATANTGTLSFTFEADEPGNYLVDYRVRDENTTTAGLVRFIVVEGDDDEALTTAPVTAFVLPNEDATVDVFSAVSNPSGSVLMLSDVVQSTPEEDTWLDADVVGQRLLRVSGATDSGRPGKLGTVDYTVVAGNGQKVAGQATVYLLQPPGGSDPIAVDDQLTVYAGAQVDVPVLANDVVAQGNNLVLDPATVEIVKGEGLAFASGRSLRFLAPDAGGTVTVRYGVYTAGYPALTDTAIVTITVVDARENRKPTPRTLTARVLSGQSVVIPFDGYGLDPDGDQVALDRIMSQPDNGFAKISDDGESIVYVSYDKAPAGQEQFRYRVRDSRGATATAVVRVGVLDEEARTAPITYSDYVEVQVGSDNQVVVSPLSNDISPTGGALTLVSVTPFASTANPKEYKRLEALIGEKSGNTVVIKAGSTAGTNTFQYRVKNNQGSQSVGLIVVRVVGDSVPDFPVVTDTILTADERDQFLTGVDVISGKVTWASGDTAGLTLSLWQPIDGVSVEGRTIRGTALPDQTTLIAFTVSGESFTGDEVVSHGFLRVPGNELLGLKAGALLEVDEDASVSAELPTLISYPENRELQIGAVAASGQRENARCSVSGTTLQYQAGTGSPWTDYCIVAARLEGQTDYTELNVPVKVDPGAPQPVFGDATLTVSPGSTEEYTLADLTTWEGAEPSTPLTYTITGGDTSLFVVTQNGAALSVRALDDARPGTAAALGINAQGYTVDAGTLTLEVGPAPGESPTGATLSLACQADRPGQCSGTVIGGPGEVNYLETPLVLSDASAQNCGLDFSFRGTAVDVSWNEDAPGVKSCEASYTVTDAQDRTGTGSVVVDFQGYPQAPSSLTWADQNSSSVTLNVETSNRQSYPDISGYRVFNGSGAEVGNCSGTSCTVDGLEQGAKDSYTARSVNSVGESLTATSSVEAWAYQSPAKPTMTSWVPTGDGKVRVILAVDENTDSVDFGGGVISRPSGGSVTADLAAANSGAEFVATPQSNSASKAGENTGQALTFTANGVGNPGNFRITASGTGRTSITVSLESEAAPNGATEVRYDFALRGSGVPCSVENATTATSRQFTVPANEKRTFFACAYTFFANDYLPSTHFGTQRSDNEFEQYAWDEPEAPTGKYGIVQSDNGTFVLESENDLRSSVPDKWGFNVKITVDSSNFGSAPVVRARYCIAFDASKCTPWGAPFTAEAADRQYPMKVAAADPPIVCSPTEATPSFAVNGGAEKGTGTLTEARFLVGDAWTDPVAGAVLTIPEGATKIQARLGWTWTDPAVTGFNSAPFSTQVFELDCVGPTPPPATPAP